MATTAATTYQLEGRLLDVCSCDVLCPCYVGADPDGGMCDSVVAWHIDTGTIQGVDVSGLTLAMSTHIPGNILKGNWRVLVYVDDQATPAQQDALVSAFTGKLGGPIADLAALIGEVAGVERAPITFTAERGRGTLTIGQTVQAEVVPFTGTTGETTTLHESIFSTIPEAPEYVGRAQRYRLKVPALGQELNLQNHNAVQDEFRFASWGKGDPMPVLHTSAINRLSTTDPQAREQTRRGRRALVLWPWLLVAVAWAVLILAGLSHQTFLLDHHYLLQASGLSWLAALEVFLLCWQVMTVAMMLPSSMLMVNLMMYAGRRQGRPVAVPLVFLSGYAVIWTAFAAGAFLGDTLVHRLVALWPWLAVHSWLIGAMTFFLAGLFQFSPWKERCLNRCRTPLGFFMHSYRKGVGAAWHLGLRHGGFCLGCCWALMLVMFGVGIGNLAGMAALTGAMVIEKAVPGGKRLSPFIGMTLLLLGVLWLAHPIWLRRAGI